MFVCVRVVLLTVLIAISQLTLEGDDLAAGCWMRTQSELLCGDLVDNQALSLVHQRALRPTIYKHLVELELQICYSSRGWTCYKYRA